jgi:large subunit ribosomal protein L24
MANKRHQPKLHIKKGDTVEVISGDYRGVTGEVTQVFPDKNRAIVSEVNIVTKHKKPTDNDPGGRIEQEASIHISNLMVVEPKTGVATRVGRKKVDGHSVRVSKKTGEIIK